MAARNAADRRERTLQIAAGSFPGHRWRRVRRADHRRDAARLLCDLFYADDAVANRVFAGQVFRFEGRCDQLPRTVLLSGNMMEDDVTTSDPSRAALADKKLRFSVEDSLLEFSDNRALEAAAELERMRWDDVLGSADQDATRRMCNRAALIPQAKTTLRLLASLPPYYRNGLAAFLRAPTPRRNKS